MNQQEAESKLSRFEIKKNKESVKKSFEREKIRFSCSGWQQRSIERENEWKHRKKNSTKKKVGVDRAKQDDEDERTLKAYKSNCGECKYSKLHSEMNSLQVESGFQMNSDSYFPPFHRPRQLAQFFSVLMTCEFVGNSVKNIKNSFRLIVALTCNFVTISAKQLLIYCHKSTKSRV